jgi:hypothetical protein
MIHMTNRVLKKSMPGMDDILRQNPDLMKSFQNATVNSMSQSAPGFSGFMSNIMNPAPSGGRPSGPPPPLATQGPAAVPPPAGRGGNNVFARQVPLPSTQNRPPPPRPEMNGPSDLSSILSGLKTKTINIQEQPSNDNSTVSISELKDLQMPGNMPKRSGRRKKSNSNTVSLDI